MHPKFVVELHYIYVKLHSALASYITCCAANSSIFIVSTVVNGSVGTVNQSALCASTLEVVQEDRNSPLAKISTAIGNCI